MANHTLRGTRGMKNEEIHNFVIQHYPLMIELPTKTSVTPAYEWCREQYGLSGNLIRMTNDDGWLDFAIDDGFDWVYNWFWFYFKDPDQAVMFKMVWG